MMVFKKAERKQAKLKIAMTAPSGGGKTLSALLLARKMGKRIAVADTENGSASLYAGSADLGIDFEYDTLEITPPYTTQKYLDSIKSAQMAGYDVLIIDSASHLWAGDGGLLAKKESLDARGGNSYTNWAGITKEHEAFKAAILSAEIHLIVTMRSKQEYVLESNDKGKMAPKKVGLAPIQRDGMEYEFTTVFDIAMNHEAAVSKDRTGLFDGKLFKITGETGQLFVDWLSSGKAIDPIVTAKIQEPVAEAKPEVEDDIPFSVCEPNQLPDKSSVACATCGAELILHSSKAGYVCPNRSKKDPKHDSIAKDKLSHFQQKQPFKPQAA